MSKDKQSSTEDIDATLQRYWRAIEAAFDESTASRRQKSSFIEIRNALRGVANAKEADFNDTNIRIRQNVTLEMCKDYEENYRVVVPPYVPST